MKCKWKINKDDITNQEFKYLTTCGYGDNSTFDVNEHYNFCPYCGKPIKIEREE